MSGAFDRYLSELESGLATLSSGSRVATMLSACERMFFVLLRPEVRGACDRAMLRKVLDSMWELQPATSPELSIPEEFALECLSDDLGLMATDAILMTKGYMLDGVHSPGIILVLAAELANQIDAAQDTGGGGDAGLVDAFLDDPGACASIEVARQFEDIATIAGAESDPTAWATLRARSAGQDITCQLLF